MRLGTVVGVVFAVVLAGALYVVIGRGRAPRGGADAAAPADTSESVIDRALGQIPADDSTAIKNRWLDHLQGIDVARLDPAQHELLVRHANARRCTCGCGFTLAACRTYDTTCPVSGPVVEALRDSILEGHIRGARGLRERPAAGG
jgi:hypothetical protein